MARRNSDKTQPNDKNQDDVSARQDDGDDSVKKERVLHTRIPVDLDQELRRFADNLRVPVSNLVRSILEDALSVADLATASVEGQLKKAKKQLADQRVQIQQRIRRNADSLPSDDASEADAPVDPLQHIFAFQTVTLAQATECAKCGKRLLPGTPANLGLSDAIPEGRSSRILICNDCLPKT